MKRCCFAVLLTSLVASMPSFAQNLTEPQKTGTSFYVQPDTSQSIPLETQTVRPKMVHGLAVIEVGPERSPIRISESRPRFIVKLTKAPEKETDVLMFLDTVSGKRTARFTVQKGLAIPMIDKQALFEFKKFGQSSYSFRPVTPLPAGEYCFGFGVSSLAFFFGIDPGAVDSPEDKAPPAMEPAKAEDPNLERLKKLDALLAKGLIDKADYDARKEEILHPAQAKPVTVEDRLKKLDDLLKKGLIAKPDYDKKRAEILSEM